MIRRKTNRMVQHNFNFRPPDLPWAIRQKKISIRASFHWETNIQVIDTVVERPQAFHPSHLSEVVRKGTSAVPESTHVREKTTYFTKKTTLKPSILSLLKL